MLAYETNIITLIRTGVVQAKCTKAEKEVWIEVLMSRNICKQESTINTALFDIKDMPCLMIMTKFEIARNPINSSS